MIKDNLGGGGGLARVVYFMPGYLVTCMYLPDAFHIYLTICRPAYLYRFSRDIPILALNHDFPISSGGVPILEDAGIFRARRFRSVLFSPVFPNPPRILHLPPVKALLCRYK